MTLTRPVGTSVPTSEHRSIFNGILAVGGFALLGKLLSAAKEMAVAWRYGVSPEVDAYLFVFNLISWPIAAWAGVLAVTLIPAEARIRERTPGSLRHFRAELLGLTVLLGLLLVVVGRIALPSLLTSGIAGLPAYTASMAAAIAPKMVWLALPGFLVALYSTWMMSGGRHANTLLEGVPALGILVAVLVTGGVQALAWGTLAGTFAQLLLVALSSKDHDLGHRPSFGLRSEHWLLFRRAFGIMMIGTAVASFSTLVDQFFAARLAEGTISSLGYASRLVALGMGILATAVTRATLPVFSRTAASEGPFIASPSGGSA